MNSLAKRNTTAVEKRFKWKDQLGKFRHPDKMGTEHIFFTLRMIWNHSAPKHLRITPYKRYKFGPFYTSHYMKQAVKALTIELSRRTDLKPYHLDCLKKITKSLEDKQESYSHRIHQLNT